MGIGKKITDIFEKIGEKTLELSEKPIRRIPQGKSIQERLQVLKKMQEEVETERKEEREKEIEELVEWREKELQKPFSERIAEAVLKYFSGPVRSLTKSLK